MPGVRSRRPGRRLRRPGGAPAAPEAAALAALIECHATGLYRLAFGIVGDRARAEAIVGGALLGLARNPAGATDRVAAHRDVVRAALGQTAGDDARAEAGLEARLPAFRPDGHRIGDDGAVLADWSALPDRELLGEEGRRVLLEGIRALPARSRAALVLCDTEGFGIEDAAEVLGEAPRTVSTRLHRARMALREQLTRSRARLAAGDRRLAAASRARRRGSGAASR
jgi:RNA polymerase sigma factor (sigma-70 family)